MGCRLALQTKMKTMKANLIISEDSKSTTFIAGSRHMSVSFAGTVGTITGSVAHAEDGTFTTISTIVMDATDFTCGIDVDCAGVAVKLETTGTFTSGTIIMEG